MTKYVTDYAEEEIKVKVDELLEELVALLEDSKDLPVVGKTMVDKNQIIDIIDEIKANLPPETRQAKAIVADRAKIINDAKDEAEAIINVAEQKRNDMLNENDIVVQAREEAEQIVEEAKAQAKSVRNAASNYVDDLMERAENVLSENLEDFRQRRQTVAMAKKKSKKSEE